MTINDILPLKDMMYRLALRITLNSQEAEDVVQDVIIKLWGMRERFDQPQPSAPEGEGEKLHNLEAFAMKMTRNLAIDRQRLHVNHTEDIDGMDFPSSASVERQIEADERIQSIKEIMQQLPEKQRTAMHLRDFEGRSYKEIADTMDITEDQVKVYIFRARQFVKTKISAFA